MAAKILVKYYRDHKREHRVQFQAQNGRILFVSGEGYKRIRSAKAAVKSLRTAFASGTLKELGA